MYNITCINISPETWPYIDYLSLINSLSPSENRIAVPIGIMHTTAFNISWTNFTRFGGIGTVIGHEITHGFDTLGSTYDEDGKLA